MNIEDSSETLARNTQHSEMGAGIDTVETGSRYDDDAADLPTRENITSDASTSVKDSENEAKLRKEPTWLLDIERLPMAEWFRRGDTDHSKPESTDGTPEPEPDAHVIAAYYNELPATSPVGNSPQLSSEDFCEAHTRQVENPKPVPLRILIQSEVLIRELQDISKFHLHQKPLALIPPYKLLVHNWEAINERLQAVKKTRDALNQGITLDVSEEAGIHKRVDHLECLWNFIQTDLAHLIGLRLKAKQKKLQTIAFDELYYLFSPGDLVVSSETGLDQLYQIYAVNGGRVRLKKPEAVFLRHRIKDYDLTAGVGTWTNLQIECYILAWDGKRIGPCQFTHQIRYFPGPRKITDLEVYPIRFLPNSSSIQQSLQERGRSVIECSGHMRYAASSLQPLWPLMVFIEGTQSRYVDNVHMEWDAIAKKRASETILQSIDSDVFIDYEPLYRYNFETNLAISNLQGPFGDVRETNESISGQDDRDFTSGDNDVDSYLTDQFRVDNRHVIRVSKPNKDLDRDRDRLQLLSCYVPAFEFRSRSWMWLDVRQVKTIDKSEEAKQSGWHDLVVPENFSKLLLSLVHKHVSGSQKEKWESKARSGSKFQIDLVRDKGRGLVILLHGPPGTGKTSTAETIAAYTGRPLYSITCGDIGVSPTEVENHLVKHTRLAERWGCVLLLDEADVFLEQRSWRDMTRNAIVSVFLRQLEYYSGILFLTTNMVGMIDEAFKSRIHVALQYPRIRRKETVEIWEKLLQRIKKDNEIAEVKIKFKKDELLRFAKDHYKEHEDTESTWNGRQIRNAFHTAIALGQYERLRKIEDATKGNADPDNSTGFIKLKVENFKSIADTASDFDTYISSFMKTGADRAYDGRYRNDYHDTQMPQDHTPHTARGMDLAESYGRRDGRSKNLGSSSRRGPTGPRANPWSLREESPERSGGRASEGKVDAQLSDDEYSDGNGGSDDGHWEG